MQEKNELDRAMNVITQMVRDGLVHGQCKFFLTIETSKNGTRRLVVQGGLGYKFEFPAADVTRLSQWDDMPW